MRVVVSEDRTRMCVVENIKGAYIAELIKQTYENRNCKHRMEYRILINGVCFAISEDKEEMKKKMDKLVDFIINERERSTRKLVI